jgi:hypothetical protein
MGFRVRWRPSSYPDPAKDWQRFRPLTNKRPRLMARNRRQISAAQLQDHPNRRPIHRSRGPKPSPSLRQPRWPSS